jgi:phosphomannomutase
MPKDVAHSSPLIVSVSGIRGIVGASLTAEAALRFASALATRVQGGTVVISSDGRPSGTMLRQAVVAGLLEAGCAVHDLRVAATPTVGIAVCSLKAAGAIQITASHNPAPWNGLKLFGSDGRVLSAADGAEVKALFESGAFARRSWDGIGSLHECRQAEDWHQQRVLEQLDVTAIRAAGLRAFVDANGGAGGPLARRLLHSLQCSPTCLGCEADGHFAHEPEPTAENLQAIGPRVAEAGADIGFALDPDADRLALLDEQGRYIGEELTLALAVLCRLHEQKGSVVINMSTSRIVEDIAARFGCPCFRSAVGEANVVERLRQVGAVIGGEGNGGVIDPRVGWVRDPFIGMGLVLSLLARTGRKLSELVAELPVYHIVKEKYTVDRQRLPALFAALEKNWPQAKVNREDGLRLDWPDRWVHVRSSNTEPVIRVIAEAPQEAQAQQLCRAVAALL